MEASPFFSPTRWTLYYYYYYISRNENPATRPALACVFCRVSSTLSLV